MVSLFAVPVPPLLSHDAWLEPWLCGLSRGLAPDTKDRAKAWGLLVGQFSQDCPSKEGEGSPSLGSRRTHPGRRSRCRPGLKGFLPRLPASLLLLGAAIPENHPDLRERAPTGELRRGRKKKKNSLHLRMPPQALQSGTLMSIAALSTQ